MAATAPIRPLAWKLTYAAGAAQEKTKKKKKKIVIGGDQVVGLFLHTHGEYFNLVLMLEGC